MNNKDKRLIAAKLKELVLNIQNFVDSVELDVAESEEMDVLMCVQSDMDNAFEELTGKSVF